MAGIFGILGTDDVAPTLISALERLEYRGYDSSGIATIDDAGELHRHRVVGKLTDLSHLLVQQPLFGKAGIGHTRWATHGSPAEGNAHPQVAGSVAVVQNGIVANYRELATSLSEAGYIGESETDAEVVALKAQQLIDGGALPFNAALETFRLLEGSFSLAFLFGGEPDLIVAAKKGAPLAIGRGEGQMFVGSDAIALAPLTENLIYLEDDDVASISRSELRIFDSEGHQVERPLRIISVEPTQEGAGTTNDVRASSSLYFDIAEVRAVASNNSVALYLNLVALEEQVGGFIERVRGSNSLDPGKKDEYISFLVQLQSDIGALASSLPNAGEELSTDEAEITATYLEGYWNHLKENIGDFLSPERTAGLTLPFGIVAISTAVGAMFGQPLTGTVFGAWLAGRASPEKVVKEVLDRRDQNPSSE